MDQSLLKRMEPRTSSPQARLRAIRELSSSNVPVRALLSPIIPGLNDFEVPKLVAAASGAGAACVRSTVVRLPGAVQDVFLDWLRQNLPNQQSRIESRIRQIRGGELTDTQFGSRMSGDGQLAKQIHSTCQLFARKHGLQEDLKPLNREAFRRPSSSPQLRLF